MQAAHVLWSVTDARAEPRGCTSSRNCVYAGPRMRTSENFPSTRLGEQGVASPFAGL